MPITLKDYQEEAIKKMKNGCILCGGVGSGKSLTSIAYYFMLHGGKLTSKNYIPMTGQPKDLYIITTARKRDTREWEKELLHFLLSPDPNQNFYNNKIVIDSWNNIKKYKDVQNAFFIFDEQRVVGWGAWSKTFITISKHNQWILLSATPGDRWSDYIPVFIANGFYKNKTEFEREHVIYSRFSKYPKIDRYVGTGRLLKYKNDILVKMDFKREAKHIKFDICCDYDTLKYKNVMKTRWNFEKNEPIQNAGELCGLLRKIVNSSEDRQVQLLTILEKHKRAIIFYNFNYELDILKNILSMFNVAEWNGHKHEPIPDKKEWIYLVQYTAGAEGWNCIDTNVIIFYSQNYSYKIMHQASGRIDRLNTPYDELYYYHLTSKSSIDKSISKTLMTKKNFNENDFMERIDRWTKNIK